MEEGNQHHAPERSMMKSLLTMVNMTRYFLGGSRVTPSTALREVVVNSIEAQASEIEINASLINGVPKIYVKDNGAGMSYKDQITYLSCVGSSGFNKDSVENFGQGARKTTLARNPYGVIWASTVANSGSGATTTVRYDTDEKAYVSSTDKFRNSKGSSSGTSVMFLGYNADEDTSNQFGLQTSVVSYLKGRFFSLPQPIKITVFGKSFILDGIGSSINNASFSIAEIPALSTKFYLLDDNSSHLSGLYVTLRDSRGLTEVYERRAASELTKYGIDAAARRIAVVIELMVSDETFSQFDRTTVVHKGLSIADWLNEDSRWPNALKQALPEEVKAFERAERERQIVPSESDFKKIISELAKLYPGLNLGLLGRPVGSKDRSKTKSKSKGKSISNKRGVGNNSGVRVPELRMDTNMEHMVAHNPDTFSILFNFEHSIAKRYTEQFTKAFSQENKVVACWALHEAWKALAIELVYTVNYAHLDASALTPESLTASLLVKSRAYRMAEGLLGNTKKVKRLKLSAAA